MTFEAPLSENRVAGSLRWRRPPTHYERFMEEEGIRIHRDIGVRDVRELPLAPWSRLGGRGTFIQLSGTNGLWGMYVVEVPGGGALKPERHIYEELFYVVEGRGTTEVWREGSTKRQVFEWQAGSLFAVPLNTWHRQVNATSSPALLLAATNAPPLMNQISDANFTFNNPFEFYDRYDESEEYFKPREELEAHAVTGRALRRSNLIPDLDRCELPLDNQRSPGYRRVEPYMAGNTFYLFIGEHATGRYSTAHRHESGAVLVCLRGKGYTYTWPQELGIRPWQDGKGDLVKRQDYVPGGMVSAAPGGGDWFHQHFGIGKEPLRVMALLGGAGGQSLLHRRFLEVAPGTEITGTNADLDEGGGTIPYHQEDPHIRKEFQEAIKGEGAEFRMPADIYQRAYR